MGTGDILLGGGGSPVMDQHPVQGGVVILLGMLHAMESMSPGCLGLWLMCTFTCTLPFVCVVK